MAHHGHLVVDADAHMREYWDLDRTYRGNIDPPYRAKYEQFSSLVKSAQRFDGDSGVGVFWPRVTPRPMGVYDAFDALPTTTSARNSNAVLNRRATSRGIDIDPAVNWDPVVRLRDMDTAEIDISIIFPSMSDGFCMLRDVGFESALARAYHRYMSEHCAPSEGRLKWMTNVIMRDIGESVEQVRYWVDRDVNFVGPFLGRAFPDGRLLDSPELHPLFEVCQGLDLPIWCHGDPGRPPLTPGPESLDNAAFSRRVFKGWSGMTGIGALIGGGAFDLFPRLRAGFFECGAGWMPWFIASLDFNYVPGSSIVPNLKRKPSEIIAAGQVFVGIEPDEAELAHCVDTLGEDFLLFSTDYPHPGSEWPDGVQCVLDQEGLSDTATYKILGGNALRMCPRLTEPVRS